jgi:hypothetical protein
VSHDINISKEAELPLKLPQQSPRKSKIESLLPPRPPKAEAKPKMQSF